MPSCLGGEQHDIQVLRLYSRSGAVDQMACSAGMQHAHPRCLGSGQLSDRMSLAAQAEPNKVCVAHESVVFSVFFQRTSCSWSCCEYRADGGVG